MVKKTSRPGLTTIIIRPSVFMSVTTYNDMTLSHRDKNGARWRWISVNIEYLLYIGFNYDLQLTHTRHTNDVTSSHLHIDLEFVVYVGN
jgi:hypothetical protein